MNIGDLIKSVMVESETTAKAVPEIDYKNFAISPNACSNDSMYANLIDITTIEIGISLIAKDKSLFNDLFAALVDHKERNNIPFNEDDLDKEVLMTKFAFEVSYKYEGLGYVVVEEVK